MTDGADVTPGSRLAAVREAIAASAVSAGRDPAQVRLIAVGKLMDLERILELAEAGQRDFGESYPKELADKARAAALPPELTWHFLGPLQSGTANKVADHAHVVHSLSPGGGLDRLAARLASGGRIVDGLIQVDFGSGRNGVSPDELDAFADEVARIEAIRLVGLMTLPPAPAPGAQPEAVRPTFRELRELRDHCLARHAGMTELSMGMSLDYRVAVEEGATMVRVGTALFGPRPTQRP